MSIQLLFDMQDKFNGITKDSIICDICASSYEFLLKWRIIFDAETKAFYVEPITNHIENSDIEGFLNRAWSQKEDVFFEGEPSTLKITKDINSNFPGLNTFTEKSNISLFLVEKKDAPIIGAASQWLRCVACLPVLDEIYTSQDLKLITKKWQILAFANGWYKRHKKVTEREIGILATPDSCVLKINFIDTPVYFERLKIKNFIDRFERAGSGLKLPF